jgi:HlyD family secretion protein
MSRTVKLLIAVIAIGVVGAGGYFYFASASPPTQTTDSSQVQTSTVRRGNLEILASGTGNLVAAKEVDLSFNTSGVIAAVNARVGDQVKAGDTLASLEEGESVETLEAAVSSAEVSRLNAQQALDQIYEDAPMKAAEAQKTLGEAMQTLNDAQYHWQVQQDGYRASGDTIAAAQANLVLAEQKVDKAQSEFNKVSGKPDGDPAHALALSNLVAAKNQRDSVLRQLNWYTGSPTEIDQMLLDADVAIAQAALEEAQRNWGILQKGPDPDEVALAESQLVNAEAQLAKSKSSLEDGIAAQNAINLTAPFDGTVLAVNAQAGETAQGAVITLGDLSQPYLEIYIDETDLDKIRIGNEVDVIFDSLPDNTYQGEVVQIDPALYTSQGASAIRALVRLNETNFAQVGTLPIGLSAAVDVVSARAENAVLVPIEALRELSAGQYAVFVMENGEPKLRTVEVGLMDFSFAQILSGLEPGEVVTTGIVETN